jgi:hypothetical protein
MRTDGRTDRRDEASNRISQFYEGTKKSLGFSHRLCISYDPHITAVVVSHNMPAVVINIRCVFCEVETEFLYTM